MPGFLEKVVVYLQCISIVEGPTSTYLAALQSLNITGSTTFNDTSNSTEPDATGFANFGHLFNSTSNCTSTLTIDANALLTVLQTATAAHDLETALPVSAVPLHATGFFSNYPAFKKFTSALPKGLNTRVLVVYPTPTGSAEATTSGGVFSSGTALKSSSTTTTRQSALVTGALAHEAATTTSSATFGTSSATLLNHLTASGFSQQTRTQRTPDVQLAREHASSKIALNSSASASITATSNSESTNGTSSSHLTATTGNTSGPAGLLAPNHSVAVAAIDSLSNSSNPFQAATNDSSGVAGHRLMVPGANSFQLSRGKKGEIDHNATGNHLSVFPWPNVTLPPYSNFSRAIAQGLGHTNYTEDAALIANLTKPLCRRGADNSTKCNSLSEPKFTFEALKNYTAQFDYIEYFDDLHDLELFPDEPEINDLEYYEMTIENLQRSRAFQWYSCWTVLMQGTDDWNKHGEWRLFWREFMGESNFNCPQGLYSCSLTPPTINEIQQKYPDNRPLARRVLFITMIYKMMHEYTKNANERFSTVENRFKDLVADIVKTFTLQVDSDKKARCDKIVAIIDQVIQISINAAIGILSDGILAAASTAMWAKFNNAVTSTAIRETEKSIAPSAGKQAANGIIEVGKSAVDTAEKGIVNAGNGMAGGSGPSVSPPESLNKIKGGFLGEAGFFGKLPTKNKVTDDSVPAGNLVTMSENMITSPLTHVPGSLFTSWVWPYEIKARLDSGQEMSMWNNVVDDAYKSWPTSKIKEYYESPDSGLRPPVELPSIVGGRGGGLAACSDFEGDWQDLNPTNIELLSKRMTAELENGRDQVWKLFSEMYRGAIPEVGEPSMVARWMLARRWLGPDIPGTVEYDLLYPRKFTHDFEVDFVKELASSTLAAGYNYIKCSHRDDAAEKCGKIGDYYESIFCPHPEKDPTLVCQSSKWYFSTSDPHEVEMVATKSIEAFGHLNGLNFELRDMLLEMYDNYEKHGNDWHPHDWGFVSLDPSERPKGFHLPVCMHDGQPFDVHVHQRPWSHNWDFPAVCGDHSANETAGFLKALTLEPGSSKHQTNSDRTFKHRIPRTFWNETPYTVYMAFCEVGVRWPNENERMFWLQTSLDQPENCGRLGYPDCPEDQPYGDRDCELVRTSTSKMTADEANIWFCTNAGGHTVFTRQRSSVWLEGQPGKKADEKWYNQDYHCGKWLEKHGAKALEAIANQTLVG